MNSFKFRSITTQEIPVQEMHFLLLEQKMTFTMARMEKLIAKKLSEKAELDFPCWFFKKIPQIICEGMVEALANGERVRLEHIGIIEVIETKPRFGRNPRTGERISIPPKKGIKFKKSEELLRVINGLPKPPPRPYYPKKEKK